jgi:hypothetical protein
MRWMVKHPVIGIAPNERQIGQIRVATSVNPMPPIENPAAGFPYSIA